MNRTTSINSTLCKYSGPLYASEEMIFAGRIPLDSNESWTELCRKSERIMNYLICFCQYCSGKIEFPEDEIGQEVQCPHCGLVTKLYRIFESGPKSNRIPVHSRLAKQVQDTSAVILRVVITTLKSGWSCFSHISWPATFRVALGLLLILLGSLLFRITPEERRLTEWAAEDLKSAVDGIGQTNSFRAEIYSKWYTERTNKAENLGRPRRFALLLVSGIGVVCLVSALLSYTKPIALLSNWPALVTAVGLVIAVFFVFYPTAIYAPAETTFDASYDELNRWVENTGLLNNRLVGVVFGIGISLLAARRTWEMILVVP